MTKKTPDELADEIDDEYGSESIGADFPTVLDTKVKASGYTEPAEIIKIEKEVIKIVREIRQRRVS